MGSFWKRAGDILARWAVDSPLVEETVQVITAGGGLGSLISGLEAQIAALKQNEPVLFCSDTDTGPNVDLYFLQLSEAVDTSRKISRFAGNKTAHSRKARMALNGFRNYVLP